MQNEDVRHPATENADLNVLGRLLLVSALLGPATGMLVGWVATSTQAAYVGGGIALGGFAGLFLAPLVQVLNVAVLLAACRAMDVSLALAARWLTILPTLVVGVIVLLVLLADRNHELTVSHGGLLVFLGPVLTAAAALRVLPWCFAPVHSSAEPTGPAGG
jgi:hypothetical protein